MPLHSRFGIHWLLPVALIAVAVFLRVTHLDLMEFKADEFHAMQLAWQNIHQNGLTLKGLQSSIGLYNPPFFIYLISIPMLFTKSPVAVTYFVVCLNVCGLVLLYRFIRGLTGRSVALTATALFASTPWTILYSRKIWAQDCLFFFLVLFYLLLASHIKRYRPIKVYALFILLSFITQLHMSAWLLPISLIIFCLLFRIRFAGKDLVIGIILFTLTYMPYIFFLLFSGTGKIHIGAPSEPWWQNLAWAFIITGGMKFSYFIGEKSFHVFFKHYWVVVFYVFFSLYYVSAVTALFRETIITVRQTRGFTQTGQATRKLQMFSLFIIVFITVQTGYFFFNIPAYPHYSIVCYPILTVLAVFFLKDMFDATGPALKTGINLLVICIIIANLCFTGAFFHYVKSNPAAIKGDYGIPYYYQEEKPPLIPDTDNNLGFEKKYGA